MKESAFTCLCLFSLSVLTCLSLISLIFWVTEGNFIRQLWLFPFPGTCVLSYGHMCRWEPKLLHQHNHFCFSVLLYLLSEIAFNLFCPQETWLLSSGVWRRAPGTFVIRGLTLRLRVIKPVLKTDIIGCHKNIWDQFCTETTETSDYSWTLVMFHQGRIWPLVFNSQKQKDNNIKCLLRNLWTSFIVK